MSHFPRLPALCLLALLSAPAWAQKVHSSEVDTYQETVSAFNRGQIVGGLGRLQQVHSPLLRKVAQGALMAQQDTPYSFTQLSAFISDNPSWPGISAIEQRAEEKLADSGMSPTQLVNWFKAHPPITLAAFDRMITALYATDHATEAESFIRERWVDGAFGSVEQKDFLKHYRHLLRAKDHWARLDRLLWNNSDDAATRMLPLVSKGQAALAKARMNLNKHTLARVPAALQGDPGLVYLRLKQARQKDQDGTAASLLALQPRDPVQDDLWWTERSIIARRYLLNKATQKAYQIAANHKLVDGMAYQQAEFLAGWIALRFLHQTDTAITHFTHVYEKSNYPISKARGAYWLGRSYQARHAEETAADWYGKAAIYPTTFYGQLAQAALDDDATLTLPLQEVDSETRDEFTAQENVQIAELLLQIGERKRAEDFILAMASDATTLGQFTLLAQLALKNERYELAIKISKLASKRGYLLNAEAYPLPDYQLRDTPEKALVLGLIRQESMFNPTVTSAAQAVGLMQMLPSTAKATAKKLDLSFSAGRLTDANYNIRLGSQFLADRLDQFDGSIIMAVASYNAGPTRVRQWVEKIGDPRHGVDPVDWIELIPVYETRNYVQRVVEGMQAYRARLNHGSSALKIARDIGATKN